MYGIGIVFLLYFYLFLLHPSWYNFILNKCQKKKWFKDSKPLIGANHTGDGAGSLYLRLGTVLFGSIGMVLLGLEGFLCISDANCHNHTIVNFIFALIFMLIQTHFFFKNSKILINRSKNIAKIGLMHLVAVNVWTWLRFVLVKHFAKANKKANQDTLYGVYATPTQIMESSSEESAELADDSLTSGDFDENGLSFIYFGDLATLLTTCIIEYSVISAGIVFVIWRSINDNDETILREIKSEVRIDCSSSSGGLFIGLLFLILALITIGIYSYFYQQCYYNIAVLVFRIGDEILFFFALFGSIIGLYRMRWLQYTHAHSNNGEFLDELLLFIGLTGELIHSFSGILCFISTQNDETEKMELYSIFIFLTRIIQVLIQSFSSSGGLFIGLLFLILALITIGIYSYFYQQCYYNIAVLVFRIGDEILFFFALFGSIIGLYRMRWLQYTHAHSNN
uniref:ATP synthase F0 subunit 8 n=1 Tax=Panagrolaimus sp. JU765 TaxID=591449 RepID=A0AC34Q3I9_9BILA